MICQLAVAIAAGLPPSERTSGENFSSSRFWITIESPNVASSGTSTPERRLRSSTVRWSR